MKLLKDEKGLEKTKVFPREIVLKHTLKNAFDFKGNINPNAVLGQILREDPALKTKVPVVLAEIRKVQKEIEGLPENEIQQRLQKIAPELLQEQKEEKQEGPLKPLPNAHKGKVVVRIAPSPSGPLHIGHAYGVSLNYEYAQMYQGKLLLRIEDTNPENIYPAAYELIEQDVQWLTDQGVAKVIVQSDRLGIYYDYAEQLVQKGKAYVCICDADTWRELKNKGLACPCRGNNVKENQTRYTKMFSSYAEGEAVLRLKTDIKDKNPAMRDFGLMRIVEHIHPRTKKEQRVWPLMVFAVAIDDHELEVTHVINGKDHTDNALKEQMIMDGFSWNHPEYKHWGRINFEGFVLSTSETRRKIEQQEYHGWDDIHLPFLPALRKRGYQPEAIRKFAIEIGLSLNDKTVSQEEFWKMINAFNKAIVEPRANRFFLIEEPVLVTITNAPTVTKYLLRHPDFPERGKREFAVNGKFYLAKGDVERLEAGKVHRLMDCVNFEKKGKKFQFHSEEYEEYKNAKNKGVIIHWLPAAEVVKAELVTVEGRSRGWGEKALTVLKEGEIIQLERRCFARVVSNEKGKIVLWYLHK